MFTLTVQGWAGTGIAQGAVCEHRSMLLERLRVPVDEFEVGTGWSLRPQGACRGEMCVPMPPDVVGDGEVDIAAAAGRLGMPLVEDATSGLWALGPETLSGHALASADAPELVLPDLDGNDFHLSSLRGQKVVVVSWAPY
jgi:hypothetical protein